MILLLSPDTVIVEIQKLRRILMSHKTCKPKKNNGGDIMTNVQDYIETDNEREEGHADTRGNNFECERPDEHLGCDLGIDVQG
jgi:hypothetical protein